MSDLLSYHEPNQKYWILFKIGSEKRIQQMREGLIYMNSLSFFSKMEGEDNQALRKDSMEELFFKVGAGESGKYFRTIEFAIGEGDDKKILDAGPEAVLSMRFPEPKNTMIFSMSAFADREDGKIPGENNGVLKLDPQMLSFGSHMLIIRNAPEFSSRINNAIHKYPHVYGSNYFQGGYGLVEYRNFENESGYIGLFRKDEKYAWQREFRFCFGIKDEGLNEKGAFELDIGDISDICDVVPIQAILDEPIKVKRRKLRLVDGKYIQVT